MKIYTKTGDDGTTSLFGGMRVGKDDLRVQVYGDVDELNSWLGLVLTSIQEPHTRDLLTQIQKDLFALGARLANPSGIKQKSKADFGTEKTTFLEKAIDRCEGKLPPQKEFILPGGGMSSACLEVARTVCRRAERNAVRLSRKETLDPPLLVYLNRLSDLLFMLARGENSKSGSGNVPWKE